MINKDEKIMRIFSREIKYEFYKQMSIFYVVRFVFRNAIHLRSSAYTQNNLTLTYENTN